MSKAKREKYNKIRKQKYTNNPDYRALVLKQSREAYRRKAGFSSSDCRNNIPALGSIASKRYVFLARDINQPKLVLSLNNVQMADALNISPSTLSKWQSSGRIPEPIYKMAFPEGTKAKAHTKVYLIPEAKAVMEIVGKHQAEFTHYRESHTATMRKIKETIYNIRKVRQK